MTGLPPRVQAEIRMQERIDEAIEAAFARLQARGESDPSAEAIAAEIDLREFTRAELRFMAQRDIRAEALRNDADVRTS